MIVLHHLCYATIHFLAVFIVFHKDAICMAWQARALWPEAGTGHLGHKLNRSRSQKITAASSLPLCPGSLWRPGSERQQGAGAQQCWISPQLPCGQCGTLAEHDNMMVPSITGLMVLSSHTASLETHISRWLTALGPLYPRGLRELNCCCWLKFISIFQE